MLARDTWSPFNASGASVAIWTLLVVIAFLIFYPLITAVIRVILEVIAGQDRIAVSDFGAAQATVFLNTFILVVGAGGLALIVGSLLAWINERTDGTVRYLGRIIPLAPMLVHPLASASGWVVLLDRRVGILNNWLRLGLAQLGLHLSSGPLNIYSFPGLILISSLQLVPFAFLIVSGALARLDPALEEASRVSHAGPLRTLLRVTFPAIAPGLANAALVTVILAIGLFTVPVVIGTGARIDVLSVHIYNLVNAGFPPRTALALALSAILMVVIQLLLVAQRAAIRVGQHAAVGGRGFRVARVELGAWRPLARVLLGAYFLATAVLPLTGLLLVSVQRFWTPTVEWGQLTLANYRYVLLQNEGTSQALLRSLALAASAATIVMFVAGFLALHSYRTDGPAKKVADALTALPATVPATILGVGMLIAFSRPPFRLYGSPVLLLLAYVVAGIPFAARTATAAASDISAELGEASRVFRASQARTFFRILLPLALPGLAAGWVLVFVLMVGEATASALLSGTGNLVIGRVLLDLWSNGSFPEMTALALIMSAVNGLCVLVVLRITRRNFELAVS